MKYREAKKILKKVVILTSMVEDCAAIKYPFSIWKWDNAFELQHRKTRLGIKLRQCIKVFGDKHPKPYTMIVEYPKGNFYRWGTCVDKEKWTTKLQQLVAQHTFYSFQIIKNNK